MTDDMLSKIAISLIPGIGCINAKALIAYCGSAEQVFKEKEKMLRQIPGIGTVLAHNIVSTNVRPRAEKEMEFLLRNHISARFYLDTDYPERLRACPDAPIVLFVKGEAEMNFPKVLSIVGTRHATDYGKQLVGQFVASLAERGYRLTIVSGLAYGIDIHAHRAALKYGLPTIGVMAHGLETVYPGLHTATANEMVEQKGALVTDFLSHSTIDRKNFIRRNRIIAGMADATIVVESAQKGGALVTAELANSYNRDVFAFPGKVGDPYSEGANFLIKSNRAALIESVEDLEYAMNWEKGKSQPDAVQPRLFVDLSPEQQQVVDLLRDEGELAIDIICIKTGLAMSKVSPLLLELEFEGLVKGLPGKVFRLK
jgi:DNA processing protein